MKQLSDEALLKAYTDAVTMNLDKSFIKLLLIELQERKMRDSMLQYENTSLNSKDRVL